MEEEIKEETPQKPTEQSIIDTIFKEKASYERANSQSRSDFDDIYDQYQGKLDDVKDKSKSQEATQKLRTEVAYIVPSIFSGQPEIEVEAIGDEDKDLAFVGEKIINYRLDTIPQAYETIEAWVKQSVVFGTSLLKVCWKFLTKQNEDGSETPTKDEPFLEVPNIKDCFYNPIITNVEEQNSLIFRSTLTVDSVKNNPIYDFKGSDGKLNREKLDPKENASIETRGSNGLTDDPLDQDSRYSSSDRINYTSAREGLVDIYERITKDRIQTVADGKNRVVLRDIENPYGFNCIKLTHEPTAIPNRFEGNGVGQNTLGLGKLYQKMMNRTLDNVALTNNAFFLFAKGTKIDKKQLVVKPGGGAEVETGGQPLNNVITPMQFPDIKQSAIAIMDKIDDEHKRASGANDLLQGAASNKTLGQDQISSTYSSNRFELINRRFKQALADLGRMILMMEIQNIQSIDAPILKIFPLEAEVVDGHIVYSRETVYQMLIAAREREDLNFNVKVKGETNIARNKDIQIKQLIDMFNLFGPSLPPQNQMEWARKILQLRGIDEIDKLIPDEEELQPEMQPMDQQMLQQGMPQQPQVM
jgi:hypothetical protein